MGHGHGRRSRWIWAASLIVPCGLRLEPLGFPFPTPLCVVLREAEIPICHENMDPALRLATTARLGDPKKHVRPHEI